MTSPGFEPKASTRAVVEEEPTQYRGRRNPTTQSRCFRILTDALVEDVNGTVRDISEKVCESLVRCEIFDASVTFESRTVQLMKKTKQKTLQLTFIAAPKSHRSKQKIILSLNLLFCIIYKQAPIHDH